MFRLKGHKKREKGIGRISMTECERLIKEGFITEDFLKEEVICDYVVETELKKIWAIELDLLREFERVCQKHNLRWFGSFGTMLGAIRHKGFIPWDDDCDVTMPREDYDILTKELYNEFKHPYFMQTPETDTEYAFSFAKLRNVNTCFASKAFIESPMNQGVFLDIYPLDLSPSEGLEERRKVIVDTLADCSAFMSRHNKYVITKHVKRASEKIYDDLDGLKYYNKMQEVATMACQNYGVNPKECEYTSLEIITFYNPDKYRMHKDIVSEYIKVPFCHMEINVPKRWHEWLTHTYGDYMKFPPVEERGIIHSGVVKAVDTTFEEARIDYIESLKNQN